MGTFQVNFTVSHITHHDRSAAVPGSLVGTGSEYTWVPAAILDGLGIIPEKNDVAFVMANGQQVTRNLGFAIIQTEGNFTIDEVVFAQPGDLALLGARSLEGLNLRVDPAGKKLVAAGPVPAAGICGDLLNRRVEVFS